MHLDRHNSFDTSLAVGAGVEPRRHLLDTYPIPFFIVPLFTLKHRFSIHENTPSRSYVGHVITQISTKIGVMFLIRIFSVQLRDRLKKKLYVGLSASGSAGTTEPRSTPHYVHNELFLYIFNASSKRFAIVNTIIAISELTLVL